MTGPDPDRPPRGALAVDEATGRVGEVMDYMTGRVYLRPPGGGPEWEADPDDVHQAGGDIETAQAPRRRP